MKLEDLMGKRFGSLVAMERQGSDKYGRAIWVCQCDCGKTTKVNSNNLKWQVRSCGCSKRQARAKPLKIPNISVL